MVRGQAVPKHAEVVPKQEQDPAPTLHLSMVAPNALEVLLVLRHATHRHARVSAMYFPISIGFIL